MREEDGGFVGEGAIWEKRLEKMERQKIDVQLSMDEAVLAIKQIKALMHPEHHEVRRIGRGGVRVRKRSVGCLVDCVHC